MVSALDSRYIYCRIHSKGTVMKVISETVSVSERRMVMEPQVFLDKIELLLSLMVATFTLLCVLTAILLIM